MKKSFSLGSVSLLRPSSAPPKGFLRKITPLGPAENPKARTGDGALRPERTDEEMIATREACCRSILAAYRDALPVNSYSIGRDALSPHNKYHFCVRWYRLKGSDADVSCVRMNIAKYLDHTLRGLLDTSLLMCRTDVKQWTPAEFGLASTFVDKHEIGKTRNSLGGNAAPKNYQDMQIRFILTLAYWLQKLDDHGMLEYPDYSEFCQWASAFCRKWFAEGRQPLGIHSHLKGLLALEPVKVINTVYTMQRLGICPQDLSAIELWHTFQKEWTRILQQSNLRLKEYLYGLSHFVLNESNFYQDPIYLDSRIDPLREALTWILDYFNEHIESILLFKDPDLAAEVALCFLLCRRDKKQDWESCKACVDLIEQCLQPDAEMLVAGSPATYVFRKGPGEKARGIKIEEHTNAVSLLALGFWVQQASKAPARPSAVSCHSGPRFSHEDWQRLCEQR